MKLSEKALKRLFDSCDRDLAHRPDGYVILSPELAKVIKDRMGTVAFRKWLLDIEDK